MIVKNNSKRVQVLPVDDFGTVTIRVLPGVSPVNDVSWEASKKHTKDLIARKDLVEMGTVDEKDAKGKVAARSKTLQDFSSTEATALIKECYDTKALAAWLDGGEGIVGETRESVRVAIKTQIDFMSDRSPMTGATKKDEE